MNATAKQVNNGFPIIRYGGHILYGVASLAAGDLTVFARAAGERGQSVTFAIESGSQLTIDATQTSYGAGLIVATVAATTTEAQLQYAFLQHPVAPMLATIEQNDGTDGTAIALQALAPTPLSAPTGGFMQFLSSRLNINTWNQRDLRASVEPVGLLYLYHALEYSRNVISKQSYWSGVARVGVAFQQATNFEYENALADLYRRDLYDAVHLFQHDFLVQMWTDSIGYSNALKDESLDAVNPDGTAKEDARLTILASVNMKWIEPALQTVDNPLYALTQIESGLWRQPIAEIIPEGADFDQDVRVEP
jgi:hypothetical protein